jgi:hypothetical protein
MAVATMQEPSPDELAREWKRLTGRLIDPEGLASLVAAIESWSTGRLATSTERHGKPIVLSWQRVDGSIFVTFR